MRHPQEVWRAELVKTCLACLNALIECSVMLAKYHCDRAKSISCGLNLHKKREECLEAV